MQKLLIFIIVFFISFNHFLFAQQGVIAGRVIDGESGESIPFATVALQRENSESPIEGSISDYDGNFVLEGVAEGVYTVSLSFMGFETQIFEQVSVTAGEEQISLGTIQLMPAQMFIDEVEVTAMARTQTSSLDRRTYRASDFETARGGTAVDVLNRLPSVAVSPDGEVSVRGTSDFVVYLNGRPTQMEPSVLLAQLSASNIESIDVISIPSARYEAQGKGGIINITTGTASVQGFSLSATGQYGDAPWGNRTDDISGYELNDMRYGGGLNLAYVNNNMVLYGGLNYQHRNVNSSRTGDARILNVEDNAYKHMVASGMKPEWYETFSANAGLELNLTERSHFAASYYHGNRTEGRKALYLYNIFMADRDKQPIEGIPYNEQWIFNPNEGIRKGIFHTMNADYALKLNENSDLGVSLIYEHSVLTHDVDNPNYIYNTETQQTNGLDLHYRQSDNTPLNGVSLLADYTYRFNNHTLRMGIQPQFFNIRGGFTYDTLHVESNTWGANTDFENQIELNRDIYAAYTDIEGSMGELSYKLGLRFEYTNQLVDIENPDYFTLFDRDNTDWSEYLKPDWFPSVHFSYPVFERDNISLAASRRISRAPLKNMAPFLYRRHLEVYLVGDPALRPEYINNAELSYSKALGQQRLTLTGFYRGVDNAIFRVNTVYDDELVLIRSFTNSGNTTALGAELNANFELGSRAKLFLGGSLYDYRVQADIFGYMEDHHSLVWSLKGNTSVDITEGLRLSADLDLVSAQVTAQGRNEMRYVANAALTYSPAQLQAWSFTLRGLNLLNSNVRGLTTRAYDSGGTQIFYQDTEFYWYGPVAELAVSYNLNWKGQRKSAQSVFGSDEF